MIKIDRKKLAAIALAGVLAFSGASTAFAEDTSTEAKQPARKQFIKIDKEEMESKFKTALDSLVKAGTITQSQADEALKYLTPGEGRVMKFKDAARINPLEETLEELVKEGTITQEQQDAILKKLQQKAEAGMQRFKALKENAKVDANEYTKEDTAERKAIPMPGMRLGHNPLKKLVSDGVLTQEQADSILEAIKESVKPELK